MKTLNAHIVNLATNPPFHLDTPVKIPNPAPLVVYPVYPDIPQQKIDSFNRDLLRLAFIRGHDPFRAHDPWPDLISSRNTANSCNSLEHPFVS